MKAGSMSARVTSHLLCSFHSHAVPTTPSFEGVSLFVGATKVSHPLLLQTCSPGTETGAIDCEKGSTHHRTATRSPTERTQEYATMKCALVYERDAGHTVPDSRGTIRTREQPWDDHHREVHGEKNDIPTKERQNNLG
eukprot:760764-Amphidinium_carterae.1